MKVPLEGEKDSLAAWVDHRDEIVNKPNNKTVFIRFFVLNIFVIDI